MGQSLVSFDLNEGGSVIIEAEDTTPGPVMRGGRTEAAVQRAGETLESVMGQVGPSVAGIVSAIRESAAWPDEVQVEFSVKISTDANVIIARSGGEANFKVTVKWSGAAADG